MVYEALQGGEGGRRVGGVIVKDSIHQLELEAPPTSSAEYRVQFDLSSTRHSQLEDTRLSTV